MPLRSSRHTRNAEHNTPARNRAGVIDYDPTDGLPVRKYVLEAVRVNQDNAAAGLDNLDPDRAGRSALDRDDGTFYPWPDLPLPSFFDQLPVHNQELIRRARRGDRSAKLSVWDPKAKTDGADGGGGAWVKWEKARSLGLVGTVMKSRHLMNVGDADAVVGSGGGAAKKRKLDSTAAAAAAGQNEDRTFEVRRWVAVPVDKADKMSDPKYLADTRAGMPNIYTNVEVLKQASGYGAPIMAVNEYSGFDLGDGGGLGSALGGGGPAAAGEATPVRRNMPPKRKKKKKLGGPGRRKAVPVEPTEQNTGATDTRPGGEPVQKVEEKKDDPMEVDGDDGDGSGDDSDGEGSEEGEPAPDPVSELAPPSEQVPTPMPVPVPVLVLAPPANEAQVPVDTAASEQKEEPVSVRGPEASADAAALTKEEKA
ncbi:hypothetical protein DV735_g5282, partial [Chaetothyriales sp. CBS 134920]